MNNCFAFNKKHDKSTIKNKIIALQLVIIMILMNGKINLANDYTGITQLGGTPWNIADGTKEWVVTEYEDGEHVGATGTKVTVYVGDDYNNGTSVNLNQGQAIGDTVYKGYDWSSCTGEDAPPANTFDTDSEQMKILVNNVGLADKSLNDIKQGATVTIISEPTIRIKNTVTGKTIEGTVTEVLAACELAAQNGVKNGDGIRYVENYAKSILTKLKEENPELYEDLLNNKDGQGQAVHQEKLYNSPTSTPIPTTTPTLTTTPIPTTTVTPTIIPDKPYVIISEGIAPSNENVPIADGKIYNDDFGVPTNPIPVTEELNVIACTDVVGTVEKLGLYTVKYEEFEYTYNLNWEQYGNYEEEYEEIARDSYGRVIYNEDGTPKMITKTRTKTGVITTGTVSSKIKLSDTATFIKITDDTNYYILDGVTITNRALPSHSFKTTENIEFTEYIFDGEDIDRVNNFATIVNKDKRFYADSGETISQEQLNTAMNEVLSNATVFDFWTKPIQDTLEADGNSIINNGLLKGEYSCFTPVTKTIPSDVENNSLGKGYTSTGIHDFKSVRPKKENTMSSFSFEVNPVRIHTPIYNEMKIISPSTNQLENLSTVTPGYKIVTLGDEFTVTVNISGPSSYYYYPDKTTKQLTLDTSKYVKEVIIECGVCGKKYHSRTHTCPYYNTLLKNDNTEYPITTTVVAINSGPTGEAEANRNEPDDVYILKQYGGIHLVGKVYDLQVRTTDDKGWKLRKAEDLAKLPIGEKGDNVITSYKYAIKLGYRAYFDLKTLGTATEDLYLTPKIYYADKNGNKKEVDIYYKTSSTEYKKLAADDIEIKMVMNKTKGNENNEDFNIERAAMLTVNPDINYNKNITIGGLKGITLKDENSVATKYNGVYTWNPTVKQSRRWYGEIYMPSSTIVVEKDAPIKDVINGKNLIKEGYLIIVFENIITRFSDESTYLQYSMGRDTDGVQFSPNASGDITKTSIMYNEKTDEEKQPLKETINLPNGATFTEYIQTDAPIVIYDVSLRANDDYETSGTH